MAKEQKKPEKQNRLVLIGNGFDLAHGLKTSYRDFLDWYFCQAFDFFCTEYHYHDPLFQIVNNEDIFNIFKQTAISIEDVEQMIGKDNKQEIKYTSNLFQRLVEAFKEKKWIDIEHYYYQMMKSYFDNPNLPEKKEVAARLNMDFDHLILKLAEYLQIVNQSLHKVKPINTIDPFGKLAQLFADSTPTSELKFLSFNYTDTLQSKRYAKEEEVINIHGRVSHIESCNFRIQR